MIVHSPMLEFWDTGFTYSETLVLCASRNVNAYFQDNPFTAVDAYTQIICQKVFFLIETMAVLVIWVLQTPTIWASSLAAVMQ